MDKKFKFESTRYFAKINIGTDVTVIPENSMEVNMMDHYNQQNSH